MSDISLFSVLSSISKSLLANRYEKQQSRKLRTARVKANPSAYLIK